MVEPGADDGEAVRAPNGLLPVCCGFVEGVPTLVDTLRPDCWALDAIAGEGFDGREFTKKPGVETPVGALPDCEFEDDCAAFAVGLEEVAPGDPAWVPWFTFRFILGPACTVR